MKLEEKKRLVKWMGGKFSLNPFDDEITYFDFKDKDSIFTEDYNPNINHEQFKEVWNKLDRQQKDRVIVNCVGVNVTGRDFADMTFNNLPKVMYTVMGVISGSQK